MYAIQNIKTKKYVFGTDRRYSPYKQRTSKNAVLTWKYAFEVRTEFLIRQCGKDYRIVKVEIETIEIIEDIEKEMKKEDEEK